MSLEDDIERLVRSRNSDMDGPDMTAIKGALVELGRRFDTVQIFASRHELDSGGTVHFQKGCGNFFANYGQVKMWVKNQEDGA